MNKEARLNLLFFGIFLFAIIVLSMYFVTSGTIIGILNITNQSGGQFNATYNLQNGTFNLGQVNEDIEYMYNLSISHIAATENLTGINITLPSTFTFRIKSNMTGNQSGSGAGITFNATPSAAGDWSGATLSWNATTGVATETGWIINYTGFMNYTFIQFNATAAIPGMYNLTVRFIYNHSFAGPFNHTNISIKVIDTTKPYNVNVSDGIFGINRSWANVSGTIHINISAYDNGNFSWDNDRFPEIAEINISFYNISGVINASYNATNNTKLSSDGSYWNITINTRTLPDGVWNVTLAVKDQGGNVNITNISNLRIDNTAPTGSMSCTPATVNSGDIVTCSCTPSDVTAGINTTYTAYTTSPSTANTGAYTESCSFVDMAGNGGTTSATYIVELNKGSGGGSGSGVSSNGSSITIYSKTIPQTSQDFSEIKTIETSTFEGGGLKVKERIKIKLNEEEHYIGIKELTVTNATIEITSDPIQVQLDIGEDTKADINKDSIYDVYVKLNGITGSVADLTINYLQEEIPESSATTGEEVVATGSSGEKEEKGMTWLWVLIIALIFLAIIVGAGIAVKKKK